MSQKSDRQQARAVVAAYYEAELAELVAHVAEAIDQSRSGELNASDVDGILFQYSRAAKELWKFCSIGNVQVSAGNCTELRRSTGGNAGHRDAQDVLSTRYRPANLSSRHGADSATFRRLSARGRLTGSDERTRGSPFLPAICGVTMARCRSGSVQPSSHCCWLPTSPPAARVGLPLMRRSLRPLRRSSLHHPIRPLRHRPRMTAYVWSLSAIPFQ